MDKINETLYNAATQVANCAATFIDLLNAFRQVTTLAGEQAGKIATQEESFLKSEEPEKIGHNSQYYRSQAITKGYIKIAMKSLIAKNANPPYTNIELAKTMSREIGLIQRTASSVIRKGEKMGIVKRSWNNGALWVEPAGKLAEELRGDEPAQEPGFGEDKELETEDKIKVDETQLP